MRENLLCCCSLVALPFATKILQVVQKVVLTVFSSSHKTSVVSRDLISQEGLTSQDKSFVLHCAKNILLIGTNLFHSDILACIQFPI